MTARMTGLVIPRLGSDCPSPLHHHQLPKPTSQSHCLGTLPLESPYKPVGDGRSSPGPLAWEPPLRTTG